LRLTVLRARLGVSRGELANIRRAFQTEDASEARRGVLREARAGLRRPVTRKEV
jgi:hypothetical protein